MAVDITNHLIPYTQVKRMLAKAWDEGKEAAWDNAQCTTHEDYNHNPYRDEP